MTAIIILNWNNANDTIHCLSSLTKADGDFRVYVVDNGSTDDSLQRINEWVDRNRDIEVSVVPLDMNYGFAKGNNKGIAFALQHNPDYFLLLNNDTEVKSDFLTRIFDFKQRHPEYSVLTPKIYFFSDKKKIWNCGGKLSMGFRKYYYAGQGDDAIKESEFIPITLVTGCALFFPAELLDADNRLLTERFFFGEEDFEFSMRMSAQGVKMACVLDSIIYHKVGASGSRMSGLGKIYLHFLNRFIDIRLHNSALFYALWSFVNIPLCLRHFYRSSRSLGRSMKLTSRLLSDARRKDGVSQADFVALVLDGTYFDKTK